MTLGQGHDTPFGHGQQWCKISSTSNSAVRSYGPDTDLGYVCTVTLTLEIWPWVKVMTHPWVMDNDVVKYYPHPTWQWGVIARTQIWVCVNFDLDLEIWPWVKVITHPWVMDDNYMKYNPVPTRQWGVMARSRILGMCAPWPRPWWYDLGSGYDTPFGSWTTITWNIIQIGQVGTKLSPGHDSNRRTDGLTDGQTHGQGDSYIPPNFVCDWYNNNHVTMNVILSFVFSGKGYFCSQSNPPVRNFSWKWFKSSPCMWLMVIINFIGVWPCVIWVSKHHWGSFYGWAY